MLYCLVLCRTKPGPPSLSPSSPIRYRADTAVDPNICIVAMFGVPAPRTSPVTTSTVYVHFANASPVLKGL